MSQSQAPCVDSMAYPPIADYALVGDCHTAALISRTGSVDWCCLPRFDSDSCCGRLLDWDKGGHFCVRPVDDQPCRERHYLDETLILVSTFTTPDGEARLYDFFSMRKGGRDNPHRQLIRIIEGVRGTVQFQVHAEPRLDTGEIKPWIQAHETARGKTFTAVGSNTGLIFGGSDGLSITRAYCLDGRLTVRAGERRHLFMQFIHPEELDNGLPAPPEAAVLDRRLEDTTRWWRQWSDKVKVAAPLRRQVLRSAIVLKALDYAPTGAVIAAPTTSLPADPGAGRNWDYRYTWIRDATFTVDSLVALGCEAEADGLRRFIERSAAGSARQMQTLYGVDGRRRQPEFELAHLEGYRGAGPVRVGNQAARQLQLDIFGEVLELSWRWHRLGRSPEPAYWQFLTDLLNETVRRWQEPDHGIWEVRGRPRHFVHSKAMCWAALDRGVQMAADMGLDGPVDEWKQARDAVRAEVERRGVSSRTGAFVQAYDTDEADAALLMLPSIGFVEYDDPRMVATVKTIRDTLERGSLLLRYRDGDNLDGHDHPFLACSFWLAECLAHQGVAEDAAEVFRNACATANDLGLFSEQYDTDNGQMLGNFPQGLTHLSHISAAVAVYQAGRAGGPALSSALRAHSGRGGKRDAQTDRSR